MTGSDFRAYVLRKGFKRTDKDTELYEATTDAVQELRRRFMFDEAEKEITTTDTISVAGEYQFANESDFGLISGVIVEDGDIGIPLIKISKAEFDQRYPSINVDTTLTGFPKYFTVYAANIYVAPRPDKLTYVFRVSYSSSGGTVISSTDPVPFTDVYRDILCDLVLSQLYDGLDEADKSNFYRQKFETGFAHARRRERLNSGMSSFAMRPIDA